MSSSRPETYLITGATGGIGSGVVSHLKSKLPPSATLIAASSRPSASSGITSQGLSFRVADYSTPSTLVPAFQGVTKLLFVSSPTFDNQKRNAQHAAVIQAAKEAGVGHVYYTSLAFGGLSDDSKVAVQAAHLVTEKMLAESGLSYTSVRMGLYADAFPLFLDWTPGDREVLLPEPGSGKLAVALRAELGEGLASLISSGKWDAEKKVLMSGTEGVEMTEMVQIIAQVTGEEVKTRVVPSQRYVDGNTEKKGGTDAQRAFYQSRLSWFEGLAKGEGEMVTDVLKEALGREPTGGRDAIRGLLKEAGGEFRWHQNESLRSR